MSEIRTCEDFVVNELLNAKAEIDELKIYNQELINKLSKLKETQKLIEKYLEIRLHKSDYKSMKYIGVSASIWSDSEDYNVILNILACRGYDFADEDEGKTE